MDRRIIYIYIYIYIIVITVSCKSKLDVEPKLTLANNSYDYSTENISTLAQSLELGFLYLFKNDTIRNVSLYIATKGDDGYFWVPLGKLEKMLEEEYGMSLSTRFNNVLYSKFNNELNINHYQKILEACKEIGTIPHIYIPQLDVLTNSEVDDSGQLISESGPITLDNIKNIQTDVYTSIYLEHTTKLVLHNLQAGIVEEVSDFISLNNKLVFIFAFRIVDPCIYPGCDDEYAHIRNCIANAWGCKVCNEIVNHNNFVNDNASGNFNSIEIQINLGFNAPHPLNEIIDCIYYEHPNNIPNLPDEYYLTGNKSYAILRSLNNFTYYHPNQGLNAQRIKKSKLPIKYFTDAGYYTSIDANKLTLCYKTTNDFNIIGDNIYNNSVLAGGIYQIRKYNAMPLYFVFPGHIPGGMFWSNGADNIINYDIQSNGIYCNNNNLSIQESFKLSPGCDFCNNNIFGLGDEYFVNTSLNFLMNYWNKDTIIVGIARGYNANIMPKQNYAKFGPGSSTCNIDFSNKTKVAELKSYSDNTIDHYILFNNQTTYYPGTVFFIKIEVSFESGSGINSCSTISTSSTYNNPSDLLRAVSLFPRGNIASLKIEVYI